MNLSERISAFALLGERLIGLNESELNPLAQLAKSQNSWFTHESVVSSLDGLGIWLTHKKLDEWISHYNIKSEPKRVGIVMAGNIPAVGFHDLLCILISGNIAVIKPSSNDSHLIRFIIDELTKIEPRFANHIELVDQLKTIDAVIATGSNNSARYFEYYFSKYPHIIRKNRTSCAVLNGEESKKSLTNLGKDIFTYFGLGCRNVSKIYAPDDYIFIDFMESMESFNHVSHHHKYRNNYDYNKSIYLVNRVDHLDNGFLLLKKDNQLVSPISVVFYELYSNESSLEALLASQRDQIQCVVSDNRWVKDSFDFGEAQQPDIDDYSDGVDTMEFLCSLQ